MAERSISLALKTSLKSNDVFVYYHLIKFEKPKPSGRDGAMAGKATDYTYITDAQYNIDWDDGDADSEGGLLGTQKYFANKVLSVGGVQETTEARASTMSLKLSAAALGTSVYDDNVLIDGHAEGIQDFVLEGLREGDRILIEQDEYAGTWSDSNYLIKEVVTGADGLTYVCTIQVTQGSPLVTEPGIGSAWATYWDYSNHNKEARIDSFSKASTAVLRNSQMQITPIDTGLAVDITPYAYTFTNISEEINALIFAKTGSSTRFVNYINRNVFIYRVHAHPEDGTIIGDPFLIFKGIIAQGTIQENVESMSTITWSLSSHWGDFARVQGRLTSDDSHRALDLTGRSDAEALLRPEYESDYGFMHADSSVNVLGTYQASELRYKTKKRGGIAGWFGGTKIKEYFELVDKDVDLRFNLSAKYLPVVYGVQKVSSIPVFADISEEVVTETDPQQLYLMYALCEGEIGGIYDIHVDETSSVCVDLNDFDAREPSGTASNEESNVEVYCYGRADRGDVLSGSHYVDRNSLLPFPLLDLDLADYRFLQVDGSFFGTELYQSLLGTAYNNSTPFSMGSGLLHEDTYSFSIPIDANFIVHTGKSDQEADNIFVNRAANSSVNKGFKIQKNYYDGDPSNYWSSSHRLLDTAYVSCVFTLQEGESTIPSYEFIVKGKYIQCYNYDYSFEHDELRAAGDEQINFLIGDYVELQLGDGVGGYTVHTDTAAQNARIIDKWYIYDKQGNKSYRLVTDYEPMELSDQTLLRFRSIKFGTGAGAEYWHMKTYDHAEGVGDVIASPITTTNSVVYGDDGSGNAKLTVVLSDADFDTYLNGNDGEVYVAFTGAPNTHFLVTSYTLATKTMLLAPHSGAGYIAEAQALPADMYISNLIYTTNLNTTVGDKIKVTRVIDGIKEERTKEIAYIAGAFAFTKAPFNESMIPSMNTASWTERVPRDTYATGIESDERVSINPAMQLLDYLTNTRYGKGLHIDNDLRLETFKLSGILCDDKSKVTVVCDFAAQPVVGESYEFKRATDSRLLFSGIVESATARKYNDTTDYWEVIFREVIGKFGYKWNDWQLFENGDLVWGFDQVSTVPSGTITSAAFQALPALGTVILTRLGGGTSITVLTDRFGGVRNTNSLVRSWTAKEYAFSSPGYSLHDSDDVKYWKYLGWDEPTQRFVTRHQANQVINTNVPLFDNINSMLKQFNGMMRYANGKYELDIKIGAPLPGEPYWEDGVTRISEDDILGDIKLDDKGQKQSYNSITANIVDPQNKYGARGISFFNSEYLKEDKGVPKQGNYSMPGITNYYTARTNIIQYLDESRYGLTATFMIDPKGYLLLAGSVISIDYTRFDWVQKLFRISTLTLQPNGLVALVVREHNDDAFLIDYSDRSAMNIDPPPPNPNPTVLEAPVGLTATGTGGVDMLEGKIVLNWAHSPTYVPGSQLVEIYTQEGPTDVPDGDYTFVFPPFDDLNTPISTLDAVTYTHDMPPGREHYVYHYWIRYVQYKNGRPSNYSLFQPLKTVDGGVEGEATASVKEAGYTLTIDPASILLEADSLGQVPVGAYTHTATTIRVLQAGTELDSVLSAPGAGQFSVTATVPSTGSFPPDVTIDTPEGASHVTGLPFTYGVMSAFDKSIRNTVVTYTVNVAGAFTHTFSQSVAAAVEGSDAWQVSGTNATHIFIANSDGVVEALNNDFANIPTVVKLGDIYHYDGVAAYDPSSFRYGTVGSSNITPGTVNINTTGDGEISISDSSLILTDGTVSSATIDIELIDNETGLVFGFVNILLTKAYSGIRGGKEFIFTAAEFGATDMAPWFTDPFTADAGVNDVTATAVVQKIIDLAENDGWIRPNDRITISDAANSLAESRIWVSPGVDSGNIGTVSASDFSTIVVEIFPGSVIVDGTLSADKITTNTIFSNNARIASNLVIGDQSDIDNIESVSINIAGTGYTVGDILTFAGGEFNSDPASVRVTAVAGGNLQAIEVAFSGDYTVLPPNPNAVTGGTGTGASIGFISNNFWGQLYSYQKTSFGDPSQGFFLNADGYFDVGDGGSYLRYDPVAGTVTLKGNLKILASNSHIMSWSALGSASLDEFNLQVFNESGGNGSVKSNTALGTGANATCEPATFTDAFYFGLADTVSDADFTSGDITYGWHVNSTAGNAKPSLGGGAGFGSTDQVPEVSIATGSLLQVMNDGNIIRWFHGVTEVFTYSTGVSPKVYSWKGVFNSLKQAPNGFTTALGLSTGVAANSSAGGATGDPGQSAFAVNLTAATQAFTYDAASNLIGPASVDIVATPLNTTLTEFYEFIVISALGVPTTVQNTTLATYEYFPDGGYANMPETVEVRLRQVSNISDVIATDQMTMAGLKEAGDSILVSMSNETHSIPTTSIGIEDYTGSGTDIEVYANGIQLIYDGGVTPANSTFKVDAVGVGISVGPLDIITDPKVASYGEAVDPMGANTAQINFAITVTDSAGQVVVVNKKQTFAKSLEGSAGDGSETSSLRGASYVVNYDTTGAIISNDIVFDVTTNIVTPIYRWYLDGVEEVGEIGATYTLDVSLDAPVIGGSIQVEVRVGDVIATPVKARDSVGVYAVQDGQDAVVAFLTNSVHVVSTDSEGNGGTFPTGEGTYKVFIKGIDKTSECAFSIPTPTAGLTMAISNGIGTEGDYSVSALTVDNATVALQVVIPFATAQSPSDITLTADFSISKAIAGTGGASATAIKLLADDYTIVYNEAGLIPTPASVALTTTVQNIVGVATYKFTESITGQGGLDRVDISPQALSTNSWTSPDTYVGAPYSITVEVFDDGTPAGSDIITLTAIKPGADGVSSVAVIVSNEAHAVPVVADVPDFTGSDTNLTLYEGATLLDFVLSPATPGPGEWTIEARNVSNISEGPAGVTSVGTTPNRYANSDEIDVLSANTGYIQFPINGQLIDGTVFSGIMKQQSFSKVTDGTSGNNTAVVAVYQRTATNVAPTSITTTETYTFSDSTLTPNIDGWTQDIPSPGAAYLWVDQATAFSSTDTDDILSAEWAGAILQGQNGTQAATLALYQQAASPTAVPVSGALRYTFSNGVLTILAGLGFNSWLTGVPPDDLSGNPIWITHTTALALTTVSVDDALSWSGAEKLAVDGAQGDTGLKGDTGDTGPTGPKGDTGTPGSWGAAMYTLLEQSTTASSQISGVKIGQVMNRAYAVEGDICIVRSSTAAAAYRSSTTSTNGTWVESLVFVDGDMVVDGAIGARELLISNLASGSAGVYIGTGAVEVHDGTRLRVKLGLL